MELSGLTNIYGDYLTQQADEAKTARMKNVASKDYTQATDDELLDVCKQFEAYFLEQIFKQMEKTIIKDEKNSSTSSLVDYFKDSTIAELATQSTETQGLGIAEMLYEQMKRNYNL